MSSVDSSTTRGRQGSATLTCDRAARQGLVPQEGDDGQAAVDQQLIESFGNMASAMMVANNLVYLIVVILVRSLLVPVVILVALALVVIGAVVVLAVTGHATNHPGRRTWDQWVIPIWIGPFGYWVLPRSSRMIVWHGPQTKSHMDHRAV